MKYWYQAVCDVHKEFTDVMVNNPSVTNHYLGDKSGGIQKWLTDHYGCELRLIWRDDQLDCCHENGYKRIRIEADKEEQT